MFLAQNLSSDTIESILTFCVKDWHFIRYWDYDFTSRVNILRCFNTGILEVRIQTSGIIICIMLFQKSYEDIQPFSHMIGQQWLTH